MKDLFKILCILFFMIFFSFCNSGHKISQNSHSYNGNKNNDNEVIQDINNPNHKLLVSNAYSEKIAVFYNRISEKYYLGSIEAGKSKSFELPENNLYVLMAIPFYKYESSGIVHSQFYRLFYYDKYRKESLLIKVILKPQIVENSCNVHFINNSNYWVDIYLNSAEYGTFLASLSPGFDTIVSLSYKNTGYHIYPVYHTPIYDLSGSGEILIEYIEQVEAKESNTLFVDRNEQKTFVLNKTSSDLIPNGAYLYITNYSNAGFKVDSILNSFRNIRVVNPDESLLFSFDDFGRYYRGLTLTTSFNSGQIFNIPDIYVEIGKVYEVTISSKLQIELENEEGISISDFQRRFEGE